jgi:hypothetical protein
MLITSDKEGYYLKMDSDEWARLWGGDVIRRPVGYSKGYFRLEVKVVSIEDPYK